MIIELENQEYNTLLLPIEWRFSAAAVGLMRFFDYIEDVEGIKLYERTHGDEDIDVYQKIGGYIEGIKYNQRDLTEERYLSFCEAFFSDEFQHLKAEQILQGDEFSEDQIALVNNLLTGQSSNNVLKKVFGKQKFDGGNKEELLFLISQNRLEIVKETFRFKTNLYRKYSNTRKMLSADNPHCRLLGYNLDEGRKSKATSYKFDTDTFIAQDYLEFDFIPFAFTNSNISFFINNNCDLDSLKKANEIIKEKMEEKDILKDNKYIREDAKTKLIKGMLEAGDFFDFDAEIIVRSNENEVYETFFVRKRALALVKKIYKTSNLRFVYKYNYDYWLDVEKEIVNCCMNGIVFDGLLERLLKISMEEKQGYASVIIDKLVKMNVEWKEMRNVDAKMWNVKKEGIEIGKKLFAKGGENKVKSYKNKIINACISHDYDRVLEIMLQISGYVESEIETIYKIVDDKQNCSDIVVCFANALGSSDKKEEIEDGE
ncbi:MAG: type I CRISPR-associated protein Cas8a1/Csx8 [Coprococcus sp.]|nr:type I CRISPR-associated protein Cas8a1/Csx8 [Coprococcus sp.]